MPFEDVVFPSRDGLRLSGWFVPSPGARAGIILCHGFPGHREEVLLWARMLYPEGFHLLLFDFRALGQSEGDLCSIGYHEVNDLLGAVDYLTARPEMQGLPLGVFGLSMGGAVSLMTAAQDERIAAVATHGAYASLDRAIAQHCRVYAGPFGSLLEKQASWWGRRWFPMEPRCVSPVDVVERIAPRPVLLFHGARDFIARPDDAHALYGAAGEPKQLQFLPHSWHRRIHAKDQPAYEKLLTEFFRDHLKDG
jgi:alpha-beta hydrolase superfamily lysophospholipase